MLFDKKCSAPLLPQPLPERGACGVGTLAVEKVNPAPVALVAVQGAQAVAVQRFLKKGKAARNRSIPGCFGCRWWGVEPTRVISTRDFEFSGGFSIWCHLVIFKVIRYPTLKRKNNSTSNEFLINLRFFVAFPLSSDFSIWNAKKEIGGIFRRDAGQNAPLLRHKTKGKSRIMNQNQAKEYYKKLFVNYPDVLSVEEATTLLGFKSQTAIIRRIHQHRIRCLKVGRSFMIPKEYLIDYLLDS